MDTATRMSLEITNRAVTEYEKDLGGDDGGPLVTIRRFYHWQVTSDVDMRPFIQEGGIWYNCTHTVVSGSPLESALQTLGRFWGDRLPGLNGIRSISDDGLKIEFCWR